MSFNPFNAPIFLKITPSLQKYLMTSAPHLFALLLISTINLPPVLLLILIICIAWSFIYFLRLYCFQSSQNSVVSIQQDSVKNWRILLANDNKTKRAHLLPSSFTSSYFIILIYNLDNSTRINKNYSVLITRDSLPKESFRILKVKLNETFA